MNIERSLVPVLVESKQLSFKTYPPPPKLILQIPLAHSIASLGECDEISRLQKKQVLVFWLILTICQFIDVFIMLI